MHELVDGWTGQTATLADAITMRDQLLRDVEGAEVKITATVDESDLIDWQARAVVALDDANRLYDSLVIFVGEHSDPGTEALGALAWHRHVTGQR